MTLQIGIVGCGRIAQAHAAALREISALHLAGVCDVDEGAAARLARFFNGAQPGNESGLSAPRVFGDHNAMAQAIRLDCAIICTPPVSHPAVVRDLLQRGVHVLCEKPLATTLEAAHAMTATAARCGVLLVLALKFRFASGVLEARKILGSGLLGEVVLFENSFCQPMEMAGRWNADARVAGGGVLMDNGPHALDLARFLVGPLTQIKAHLSRVQPLPVEDTARLCFQAQPLNAGRPVAGVIDLSWSLDKGSDAFIAVHGTRGTLHIGWSGSRWRVHDNGAPGEWQLFSGYDRHEAFVRQLQNFAASVARTQSPCVSTEDALACVQTVETA